MRTRHQAKRKHQLEVFPVRLMDVASSPIENSLFKPTRRTQFTKERRNSAVDSARINSTRKLVPRIMKGSFMPNGLASHVKGARPSSLPMCIWRTIWGERPSARRKEQSARWFTWRDASSANHRIKIQWYFSTFCFIDHGMYFRFVFESVGSSYFSKK